MLWQISKILTSVILLLSVYFVFSSHKFFPFSNYPMFMYAKKQRVLNALIINYKDGRRAFVPPRYLRPFTRLHIHQMIASSLMQKKLEKDLQFNWVKYFVENSIMKREADVLSVSVERVQFSADNFKKPTLEESKSYKIHELFVESL